MSFISKFNRPFSTFYIILLSFALILSMPIVVMQFNNFIKSLNPYSLLSSSTSSFPSYYAFFQYYFFFFFFFFYFFCKIFYTKKTALGVPALSDPNLKAQLVFPGSTKG